VVRRFSICWAVLYPITVGFVYGNVNYNIYGNGPAAALKRLALLSTRLGGEPGKC